MVAITHESSMAVYNRLLRYPPEGPLVPSKPSRPDAYAFNGKSVVALVRCGNRIKGIKEAISLMGGLEPLVEGVDGEILIKPNCNTDDPYPRDTHPETVRTVVEALIRAGFRADKIVLGETSGRARGLPTRHTLENIGMKAVVDNLGLQVACFEEEEWATVKPPGSSYWPDGIKIPRKVYEAERVILAPIMRPHSTATFTISMKLAVGMLDSVGREWLHDGEDHHEKLVELNLAYSADLIVADATQIITGYSPSVVAEPRVIVAGSNRVATDAVCVALMKLHGADRVSDRPVLEHGQFTFARGLGLGSPLLADIDLRTSDLVGDSRFESLASGIEEELRG
ncbi:MAG: DUF362 domain-containing protein [Candidatus Bathyarchaeota archaeon]|nr:MAG: DUF362 domain-containing protein [Candidatus Bathyarchaeota archaeon]